MNEPKRAYDDNDHTNKEEEDDDETSMISNHQASSWYEEPEDHDVAATTPHWQEEEQQPQHHHQTYHDEEQDPSSYDDDIQLADAATTAAAAVGDDDDNDVPLTLPETASPTRFGNNDNNNSIHNIDGASSNDASSTRSNFNGRSQRELHQQPGHLKRKKKSNVVATYNIGYVENSYTMRLNQLLEDSEKSIPRFCNVVSWLSHGRAFKIHDEEIFVTTVMPKYFNAKLPSFYRWLRAWGFQRQTEGKDRGSWYHRYFVRGVTHLCMNMNRQQMLQAMNDWKIPVGQVPDFHNASTSNVLSEIHFPAGEEEGEEINAAASADNNSNVTVPFCKDPKRLRGTILEDVREMLQDAEDENDEHIVSWVLNGRAFKVHDKATFQKILMPRYFKANKLTYFSDALRLWGFQRLGKKGTNPKYKGAYYHKCFVRDDISICRHRSRQKMKEIMTGWSEETDPSLHLPVANHQTTVAAQLLDSDDTATKLPGISEDAAKITDQVTKNASQPHYNQNMGSTMNQPFATGDLLPPIAEAKAFPESKQDAASNNNKIAGDVTYVLRIHEMLEDAEKNSFTSIVSWQSHGRAFKIHDEENFVATIMPRYFKAKLPNLLRWLRAWGFCRITEGRDRGAWYHRYFIRGVTSLCKNMSRTDMLKAMEDWLSLGQGPDFYSSGTGLGYSESSTFEETVSKPSLAQKAKYLRGTVPEDLRAMLYDSEAHGNTHIVTWLPHGRAFKVVAKAAFANQLLPHYFKTSKASHFSDALRVWGFKRLKKGENKGAYFHRLFVKGKPHLTRHLSRQQMKDAMSGWPLAVEPDLSLPDVDRVLEEGLEAQRIMMEAEGNPSPSKGVARKPTSAGPLSEPRDTDRDGNGIAKEEKYGVAI